MRSLDEIAHDLRWCAPWALDLFQNLLEEYRGRLHEQPDQRHLELLRIWEGNAPGQRRHCYPPVALARPGLDSVVRHEVLARGRKLVERLSGPVAGEVAALLTQFELQQPERRGLDDLAQLLRTLRRDGAVLACHLGAWPLELPVGLSEVAYEIVAEGLRNAIRHGDGSRRASLRLKLKHGELRVEIRNPLGASPLRTQGSGLGLRHLRWRVRSWRGRYRFEQVDQLARLRVRLPLQ
ncbi:hypothetical protein JST97_14685 [bacterium]|nr:hypothetical protein [bacterium]